MSRTTSRTYRDSGVSKDSSVLARSDFGNENSSPDQEKLAALILKAARLWQSNQTAETLNCNHRDAPGLIESIDESDEVSEQILKTLQSRGHARPSDLARLCRVSQPTVQRRLKELLLAELIVKHGNTKGVTYALPKTEK